MEHVHFPEGDYADMTVEKKPRYETPLVYHDENSPAVNMPSKRKTYNEGVLIENVPSTQTKSNSELKENLNNKAAKIPLSEKLRKCKTSDNDEEETSDNSRDENITMALKKMKEEHFCESETSPLDLDEFTMQQANVTFNLKIASTPQSSFPDENEEACGQRQMHFMTPITEVTEYSRSRFSSSIESNTQSFTGEEAAQFMERQRIVRQLDPPIETYSGFYNYKDQSVDLKRQLEVSTRSFMDEDDPLCVELGKHEYVIGQRLGEGSSVYLATRDEDVGTFAIKVSRPGKEWEFYILRSLHQKLENDERTKNSLSQAIEFWAFEDESIMLMPYYEQGTLLDYVNKCRQESIVISDLLTAFFICELARSVAGLHRVGITHGDIRPETVLCRLGHDKVTASYALKGDEGWACRGIRLIGLSNSGVEKAADWRGCAEVLYTMLHGRRLETEDGQVRKTASGPLAEIWMAAFNTWLAGEGGCVDEMLEKEIVERCGRKGRELTDALFGVELLLLG